MKIYAFDFDGTLTTRDTLLAFIRYARGDGRFVLGMLRYAPMTMTDFDALCQRFAVDNRQLLRPKGVETMRQALADGARVIVVSASIDNWVRPFFGEEVEVMGTQVEVSDGRLTGRFLTRNCYGAEKVRRISERYPHRSEYELTAFGDSRGDKELLEYADEGHYKPFR